MAMIGQAFCLWRQRMTFPILSNSLCRIRALPPCLAKVNYCSLNFKIPQDLCRKVSPLQIYCLQRSTTSFKICSRNYAGQLKSPYNVSRDFSRDILVYSYDNKKVFRYMTILGVVQFIMWANLSSFFYKFFATADRKIEEKQEKKTWWRKLIALQTKYKYCSAIFCMMVASIALFFTWVYPMRTIHQLTVLSGGKNIRMTTYYHFGMTRNVDMPMENISFNASRQFRKDSTLSARIKGKWFYFLLDTRKGIFHNPDVFDHVVGLQRKF